MGERVSGCVCERGQRKKESRETVTVTVAVRETEKRKRNFILSTNESKDGRQRSAISGREGSVPNWERGERQREAEENHGSPLKRESLWAVYRIHRCCMYSSEDICVELLYETRGPEARCQGRPLLVLHLRVKKRTPVGGPQE